MKLLTDKLRAHLPPLYSQEAEADPIVYAKFFLPGSGWTWYVTEGGEQENDFLFFGFVVVKALAIRHVPPAQLRPIVGADGVALNSIGPNGGLVRVSAEEWQAVTAGERIREGNPVHVLSIDGLVLTVEAITDEHAPTGQRAPVSEGGNPA